MTVEKSIIRAHVLNELGSKTDDFLESYKGELKEHEGIALGLTRAEQATQALFPLIDKDIDSHQLDLVSGKLVKDWIVRNIASLQSLKETAKNQLFVTRGKIEAAQQQVAFIKRIYDIEKARLESYTQPQETHDNVIPIGGSESKERPLSLKTRRLQEEQGGTSKKKRPRKKQLAPKTAAVAPPEAAPETAHSQEPSS